MKNLILYESEEFKQFKLKVKEGFKQDSAFKQMVEELMFANYCKFRDYYKQTIN